MTDFITFCGVFRNEAPRIRQILDFAQKMFPEMILAVQQSDDATLQICKEYTSNIIERPSESPEESKDFVMEQVKTPWTLWFDADEFPSVNLIHFFERITPADLFNVDAVSFVRINYIDGLIINGNQGEDRQFRLIRKDVRWDPKTQGKRIHIHPLVKKPKMSDHLFYHHRTLQKIKDQTKRWNELESQTKEACDKYVKDVEAELCQKLK